MKLDQFEFVEKENEPHGKVILVGMMEDGPTGAPFRLFGDKSPKRLLGDNEISRSYELLLEKGTPVENIVLFRLNGKPAELTLRTETEEYIVFQSFVSHSEENNIQITISDEGLSLFSDYSQEVIDRGKRKNFKRTYLFKDYLYMNELAEAVTKDAALGFHNIIAESKSLEQSSILSELSGTFVFSEGDEEDYMTIQDGVFPEGDIEEEHTYLYNYWQRYFTWLLGKDFDGESSTKLFDIDAEVIYFPDLPADEAEEIVLLSGRIAKQKTESQDVLCTALFRTTPIPKERVLEEGEFIDSDGLYLNISTGEMEEWLPKKEQEAFLKKMNHLFTEEENSMEEMKNIQIVIGEEETPENHIFPGAAHHLVHLISESLSPTTNKELFGFWQINAPLDKNVIDKLSAKGYICIMESLRRNAVTSKVQSMYSEEKVSDSFYFNKILSYITYDIRKMFDQFIGTNIKAQNLAEIEDQLTEYLQQYVDARLVQSFALGERAGEETEYSSDIEIEISLYGELATLKGSLQLNESGWEVDLWNIMR